MSGTFENKPSFLYPQNGNDKIQPFHPDGELVVYLSDEDAKKSYRDLWEKANNESQQKDTKIARDIDIAENMIPAYLCGKMADKQFESINGHNTVRTKKGVKLDCRLGRGGYGEVWKGKEVNGKHESLVAEKAVKIIPLLSGCRLEIDATTGLEVQVFSEVKIGDESFEIDIHSVLHGIESYDLDEKPSYFDDFQNAIKNFYCKLCDVNQDEADSFYVDFASIICDAQTTQELYDQRKLYWSIMKQYLLNIYENTQHNNPVWRLFEKKKIQENRASLRLDDNAEMEDNEKINWMRSDITGKIMEIAATQHANIFKKNEPYSTDETLSGEILHSEDMVYVINPLGRAVHDELIDAAKNKQLTETGQLLGVKIEERESLFDTETVASLPFIKSLEFTFSAYIQSCAIPSFLHNDPKVENTAGIAVPKKDYVEALIDCVSEQNDGKTLALNEKAQDKDHKDLIEITKPIVKEIAAVYAEKKDYSRLTHLVHEIEKYIEYFAYEKDLLSQKTEDLVLISGEVKQNILDLAQAIPNEKRTKDLQSLIEEIELEPESKQKVLCSKIVNQLRAIAKDNPELIQDCLSIPKIKEKYSVLSGFFDFGSAFDTALQIVDYMAYVKNPGLSNSPQETRPAISTRYNDVYQKTDYNHFKRVDIYAKGVMLNDFVRGRKADGTAPAGIEAALENALVEHAQDIVKNKLLSDEKIEIIIGEPVLERVTHNGKECITDKRLSYINDDFLLEKLKEVLKARADLWNSIIFYNVVSPEALEKAKINPNTVFKTVHCSEKNPYCFEYDAADVINLMDVLFADIVGVSSIADLKKETLEQVGFSGEQFDARLKRPLVINYQQRLRNYCDDKNLTPELRKDAEEALHEADKLKNYIGKELMTGARTLDQSVEKESYQIVHDVIDRCAQHLGGNLEQKLAFIFPASKNEQLTDTIFYAIRDIDVHAKQVLSKQIDAILIDISRQNPSIEPGKQCYKMAVKPVISLLKGALNKSFISLINQDLNFINSEELEGLIKQGNFISDQLPDIFKKYTENESTEKIATQNDVPSLYKQLGIEYVPLTKLADDARVSAEFSFESSWQKLEFLKDQNQEIIDVEIPKQESLIQGLRKFFKQISGKKATMSKEIFEEKINTIREKLDEANKKIAEYRKEYENKKNEQKEIVSLLRSNLSVGIKTQDYSQNKGVLLSYEQLSFVKDTLFTQQEINILTAENITAESIQFQFGYESKMLSDIMLEEFVLSVLKDHLLSNTEWRINGLPSNQKNEIISRIQGYIESYMRAGQLTSSQKKMLLDKKLVSLQYIIENSAISYQQDVAESEEKLLEIANRLKNEYWVLPSNFTIEDIQKNSSLSSLFTANDGIVIEQKLYDALKDRSLLNDSNVVEINQKHSHSYFENIMRNNHSNIEAAALRHALNNGFINEFSLFQLRNIGFQQQQILKSQTIAEAIDACFMYPHMNQHKNIKTIATISAAKSKDYEFLLNELQQHIYKNPKIDSVIHAQNILLQGLVIDIQECLSMSELYDILFDYGFSISECSDFYTNERAYTSMAFSELLDEFKNSLNKSTNVAQTMQEIEDVFISTANILSQQNEFRVSRFQSAMSSRLTEKTIRFFADEFIYMAGEGSMVPEAIEGELGESFDALMAESIEQDSFEAVPAETFSGEYPFGDVEEDESLGMEESMPSDIIQKLQESVANLIPINIQDITDEQVEDLGEAKMKTSEQPQFIESDKGQIEQFESTEESILEKSIANLKPLDVDDIDLSDYE